MKDPSANFTRLNPGGNRILLFMCRRAWRSFCTHSRPIWGPWQCRSWNPRGIQRCCLERGRHRGSSWRSHGCGSRWKWLWRRGLLTRSNPRLAKRHLLTLNELFEKLIAFLHDRCLFLVAVIERHKAFVRVFRDLKGFGGILHQLHGVEKILTNVLSLAHQQFLHAHIDKLGAGATDLPSKFSSCFWIALIPAKIGAPSRVQRGEGESVARPERSTESWTGACVI